MTENIYQIRIRHWQEKYGGLSPKTEKQLYKLMNQIAKEINSVGIKKDISITVGTRLIREFQGQKHTVLVVEDGFEYKGKIYKYLSSIANEITGSHWNGNRFFGVT